MKTLFYLFFLILLTFGKLSFPQNNNFSEIEKELSRFSPKSTEPFTPKEIDELLFIEDVSPELSIEGRKPILLIHGWSFDGDPAPPSGGYWDYFKDYLMNDSTLRANFKPYYVKYWSNEVSVHDLGEALRIKIEEEGFNEQKIVIVAHSMGGLVARSYMTEQVFTQGAATGKQCGKLVDRLITLATPHHGSPMANGPARNAKLGFLLNLSINTLEAAVFKEVKYNEFNRVDLWWDNYDGLLNYAAYPDEKNNWLVNLNRNITFDLKTICYTGVVDGKFLFPESGNLTEEYQLGSWFMQQGFSFQNDGIVPVQSSGFEGHNIKGVRHFYEYNHADIVRGKDNKFELFVPLKWDLSDVFPLRIIWPNASTALYLKHAQNFDITWETPSTINELNIYLSDDLGKTFSIIASKVDAQIGTYSWKTPDINSNECLIKITNADFENEQAVSLQSFTIYDNQLAFTAPLQPDYFVRSRPDTIKWTQVGLGNKVRISYIDPENAIQKIITQETTTAVGNNTYIWGSDESLPPTNHGTIQIELLGLNEAYGDNENYLFTSEPIMLLGEPTITLFSPETSPVDFFGITGEKLLIGETDTIKWKAEGEIKFIEIFLCNKNKQVLKSIKTITTLPALEITGSTPWTIPEFYGDEFYLMAKAGYSSDSITIETYSDNSIRINKQTRIDKPADKEADVSLQPCFDVDNLANASKYEFLLESIEQNNEPHKSWKYESQNSTYCIPYNLENELAPGRSYQLTAIAWIDTISTYADRVIFKCEEAKPRDFPIIEPLEGDSVEGNELNITWQRAVGTNHYSLQLIQLGEPITTVETLEQSDTSFIALISDVIYYKPIELIITATNEFGSVSATTNFIKKFKTGINRLPSEQVQLTLINYPNPFSQQTTFEFYLPDNTNDLQLNIYDLIGHKIATIQQGPYRRGKHQIVWNREVSIKNGIYIYQIKANGLIEHKLLTIK